MTSTQEQATFPVTQKAAIRKIVNTMLAEMDVPYIVTPYNQKLHDLCCERAILKGYPMGTDPSVLSLRPYITSGVIMSMTAYAHMDRDGTQVFMALYTAFLVFVDDTYENNNTAIRVFIERFIRGEKQMKPVLDGLAEFLQEIPDHYEPIAANIVLTAALNLINASSIEFQTKQMKASLHATSYPAFTRQMSGSSATYALTAFPRDVPLESYIQCIPDAIDCIGWVNDVLSFYKEEVLGETVNYVSCLARAEGLSNLEACERMANDAVVVEARVSNILAVEPKAYDAWRNFVVGYVGFHTSFDRYRMDELMRE